MRARARIRVAGPGDAAQVLAIYAPNVTDGFVSFELEPPSLAEMASRIARTVQTHPWLVHEADGRIEGYAYGGRHRDRNAYAGIALPNEASVRLHESVGFEPLGVYRGVGYKKGAWRDVGWWSRRLASLTPDPTPPRPFEG